MCTKATSSHNLYIYNLVNVPQSFTGNRAVTS